MVYEQEFRVSGQRFRPFSNLSDVHCRGCSTALQRVITDFGADHAFALVLKKLQEHYGIGLVGAVGPCNGRSGQRLAVPGRHRLCGALLCGRVCRVGNRECSKRQCGDDNNELQVIDVHDLVSPILKTIAG